MKRCKQESVISDQILFQSWGFKLVFSAIVLRLCMLNTMFCIDVGICYPVNDMKTRYDI